MKVICGIFNFLCGYLLPPVFMLFFFSIEIFYKRLDVFICLDKHIEFSVYPSKSADVENYDEKIFILLD